MDFEWGPYTERASSFETFTEKPKMSSLWMGDHTITLHNEERISSFLESMDLGGMNDN